jgi:spore coat polysaccharide biosynthesis predicted glycosyltransferase SpsG
LKIAFRIDAGDKIGMGHFTRMTALADAFSEYGHESSFFYSKDEPVNFSDFDIIVVDSYELSDEYIANLNRHGKFVVCYDDNALYEYSCDVLINANLHSSELTFRLGEKKPHLLLGGQYAILRPEFWAAEPIKIKEDANRIFVCFGGADIRNITPKVVATLQDIPNADIVAVLGVATHCDDEVKDIAKENVTILKNPPSISSVMRTCDMAVVSSSSMIYELAALGIPALLITQADNQEWVADYMTKQGLMKCIGDWRDYKTSDVTIETITLLNDVLRRRKESVRLLRAVNRKGALNAAKEIERLAVEVA